MACFIAVLFCVVVSIIPALATVVEICDGESNSLQCPSGQTILVTEARYGRMYLGRCVQTDMGYIGCWTFVTDQVQGICDIAGDTCVIEPLALIIGPGASYSCHRDLHGFLEITYECSDESNVYIMTSGAKDLHHKCIYYAIISSLLCTLFFLK